MTCVECLMWGYCDRLMKRGCTSEKKTVQPVVHIVVVE